MFCFLHSYKKRVTLICAILTNFIMLYFSNLLDFIDGNDEEYCVEYYSMGWLYRQETVLTEASDNLARRRTARSAVNLSTTTTLFIFPNSEGEAVHIAVRSEERADVIILDIFGRTMQTKTMKSGGVLTVATADFAAGIYAVRVQGGGFAGGGRKVCSGEVNL